MTNEIFHEWVADVMQLPQLQRHEVINGRWNELTVEQRETAVISFPDRGAKESNH